MGYKITTQPVGRSKRIAVGKDWVLPERYALDAVPNADETGPALRMVFEVIDGVPQCRELRLVSTDSGRELQQADLRRIPLEYQIEWAAMQVATAPGATHRRQAGVTYIDLDDADWDDFLAEVRTARRKVRRSGPTSVELREAATIYQSAEHAPTAAVAEHFEIAHRTASLWISRARKLGYL